ncbi:minor tail protein [Streptomyces phage Kardashian]|nr:minor tail protein [Streptomyces phage Kardashian]
MLTTIEARSRQGNLLSLPLEDDSSGLRVAKIEGLDPVKANLVSSGFANSDGEIFQSSRRETRNIKLNIELDPNPESGDTVRDLRKRLYRFFMPESEIKLTFVLEEGLDVDIVGRIESCETDHFSQEPAVDISIICFDPDFIDPTPMVVTGMSTADVDPMIVDYEGTVEVGVVITLGPVVEAIPDFVLYHTLPNDEVRTLEFDNIALAVGDTLTISTVFGSKGATLVHDGASSSALYGISPQSNWIALEPGENQLKLYSSVAGGSPWSVEYFNKYGGL